MRKCRIGTAKFFTLLLLLYRTSVNDDGLWCRYSSYDNKLGFYFGYNATLFELRGTTEFPSSEDSYLTMAVFFPPEEIEKNGLNDDFLSVWSWDCAKEVGNDMRSYLSTEYALTRYTGIDFFENYIGENADRYDSFRVTSIGDYIYVIGYESNDQGSITQIRAITMNNGILYDFIYDAGDNESFEWSDEFFGLIDSCRYPTEDEVLEKYVY